MTAALLTTILTTINAAIDLYARLLDSASPEKRQTMADMIIEQQKWWHDNVWSKLGAWLEKL